MIVGNMFWRGYTINNWLNMSFNQSVWLLRIVRIISTKELILFDLNFLVCYQRQRL